jgi:hypothetical protein
VGTKVLMAHGGDDWARKCWSARGMSGCENAGTPKGLFYRSFTSTLTSIKLLATMFESVVPLHPNVSQ